MARLDAARPRIEAATNNATGQTYCPVDRTDALRALAEAAAAKQTMRVLNPSLCLVMFLRSYALTNLGRRDEALAQLRQLAAIAPRNAQFRNEFAFALHSHGDFDAAVAEYHAVVDLVTTASSPPDAHLLAVAWRGVGSTLVDKGDYDGAEAAYKTSLTYEPASEIAANELAFIAKSRKTSASSHMEVYDPLTHGSAAPVKP